MPSIDLLGNLFLTALWNMYGQSANEKSKNGENTKFCLKFNLLSGERRFLTWLVFLRNIWLFSRDLGQEKLRHIKHTCFCFSSFSRTAFSLLRRSPSRLWYCQRFFFTFWSVLYCSFPFSSSWLSLPFSGEFCFCSFIVSTFSVVLYKIKKT